MIAETIAIAAKVVAEEAVVVVDGIKYSGHFFCTVAIERESNGQAVTQSIVYFSLCVGFPRFYITFE